MNEYSRAWWDIWSQAVGINKYLQRGGRKCFAQVKVRLKEEEDERKCCWNGRTTNVVGRSATKLLEDHNFSCHSHECYFYKHIVRSVPQTTRQNVLVAEVTFALCPPTSRGSSCQLGPAAKPYFWQWGSILESSEVLLRAYAAAS